MTMSYFIYQFIITYSFSSFCSTINDSIHISLHDFSSWDISQEMKLAGWIKCLIFSLILLFKYSSLPSPPHPSLTPRPPRLPPVSMPPRYCPRVLYNCSYKPFTLLMCLFLYLWKWKNSFPPKLNTLFFLTLIVWEDAFPHIPASNKF